MEFEEQPVNREMSARVPRGIINCLLSDSTLGLNKKVHVSDDTSLPEKNGESLG